MNTAWFGIRVKSRSEARAADELSMRGFEAFLPARRIKRRWSDRTKAVDEPLFPGYLFCRFRRPDRLRILNSPGVAYIVGFGDTPIPISDTEIGAIKTMIASKVMLTPWPYLQAGQRVWIDRGPLAGLEGLIVEAKRGNPRLVVSVNLLQRSVAAEIERDWIGSLKYSPG
ncbi:MAG: UpxY family transcription antiterminator [Acidobacteriia bacterium]|nr:UpxY family transcription antiterminator [Terriglobia bacterium]